MATEVGTAYIPIKPDLAGFGKDLDRSIKRESEGAMGSMKAIGKNMAGAFGAAFAVDKLFDFGAGALQAAGEARKVAGQTDAVIKSTGGAANVTVKQVGDLAERLKGVSGVEDEVIQSGQNMLLTFTNIRNEAGKGNDVFNQATETLLDMSVATGQDAKSAAVQLGKALNDPIAGISALSRVGVTFTDEQKQQIRTMTEAGDVAGAQKVILAELNKEFGGSAKAAGDARTPMDKLGQAFGDVQEKVGLALLPTIEKLATWFTEKGLPALQRFGGYLVETFTPVVDKVREAFKENQPAIETVMTALGKFAGFVLEHVVPVLVKIYAEYLKFMIDRFGENVRIIREVVIPGFLYLAEKVLWVVETIVTGAAKAFGWVPGIGEKLKTAAEDIGNFRDDVNRALDGIKDKTIKINLDVRGEQLGQWARLNQAERRDGPGRGAAGSVLARVQRAMAPGAYVTSAYRTPAQNRAVGGSPTSYHLDRNNPAVDVGGTRSALAATFSRLVGSGPWRELLFGVPGHYDHIHAAHTGGMVEKWWPKGGMVGLGPLERPAILQVGEQVLSRQEVDRRGAPLIGEQHFHEKVDPLLLAHELSWQLA